MSKKISLEKRLEKYEDFYKRAFTDADIEDIFENGGQLSLSNFRKRSKDHVKESGYWDAMFGREKESKTLGKQIFKHFFEDERITQNVNSRIIVRKGQSVNFGGKVRTGGQFLPRAFFKRKSRGL